MTDTLLPCPFCGGEARYGMTFAGEEVYCSECSAAMPRKTTEAEAVAAWNTRTERTCHIEEFRSGWIMDDPFFCALSCGHNFDWWDEEPPNYCPNCGARVVV